MSSIWWVRKDQLDKDQLRLVEGLPLGDNALVFGKPGSGKTNVLLRRAQFVRTQGMPRILVLTLTRPLAEFMKTGCYDGQGKVILNPQLVETVDTWARMSCNQHGVTIPEGGDYKTSRQSLAAATATAFLKSSVPKYDCIFVDEAQDLYEEEVRLIKTAAKTAVFAADPNQKIYSEAHGVEAIRRIYRDITEHTLCFHYRIAPEISEIADRILLSEGGQTLSSTSLYKGPKPGRVSVHGPESRELQTAKAVEAISGQLRAYGDLIESGDRIGVVTARKDDRDELGEELNQSVDLQGKVQVIRSRMSGEKDYDPSFDPSKPICVLTMHGCKGLEFRCLHWLYADERTYQQKPELVYTTITRAKTAIDIYCERTLPPELAEAIAPTTDMEW